MENFILLKRSYPISQYERYCDGYDFFIEHTTKEDRESWGVNEKDLQKIINIGEKYIYQVAKINKEFHTHYMSISNFRLIRKYLFDNEF